MATGGQFPKDDTAPKTDVIFEADFTSLRTSIFAIIGTGSGTSGYGATQAATLGATTVNAGDVIYGTAWDTLRTAINACRSHQTASPTLIDARPTAITAAWVNSVKTICDAAVTNKDSVKAAELVLVTGVTNSVTTSTTWNGFLTRTVRVTFPSQNAMRNFFNAGGYITTTHAAVTGNSGTKEDNWKTAIDNLGACNYTVSDYRAGGTRTLGSRNVASYDGSSAIVQGIRSSLTGSAYVDIVITYDDGNSASGLPIESSAAQTGRIDETLSLNISSTVSYYKSDGSITSPTPNGTGSWTDSGYSASSSPPPPPPPPPPPAVPTYSFSTVPVSINEGSAGSFVVTTTNVPNGTVLYYTIDNLSTEAADFTGSVVQGSVTINSNTGSFNITPSADVTTEGAQTFRVYLRTDSVSGTIVATSASVTINDTSVAGPPPPPPPVPPPPPPPAAPTYSFTTTPASVNEGSAATFVVATTNVANGTTLYYVVDNITTGGDFGTLSGSFTINSNSGTFSVTPTADALTEGTESFRMLVKTGSTTGTTVATSASVNVNDTSFDVTYNFAPEFLDEFAASYGYTGTTPRSIFLTQAQNINTVYYATDNPIAGAFPARFGVNRKPDAAGLAYWTDFALDNGYNTGSAGFVTAWTGALSGNDLTRSTTGSTVFDAGNGDGDFYDRSINNSTGAVQIV